MKRWAVVGLVLLFAGLAGFFGLRVLDLTGDLNQARSDIDALEDQVDGLTNGKGQSTEQLDASEHEIKALNRELRDTRRELRERQPCPNYPRLILFPASGPPGTRVSFTGYCFTDDYAGYDLNKDWGYSLFITRPSPDLSDRDSESNGGPTCELIGGTQPHRLDVRKNGTAYGYLTIPFRGGCFQEDRSGAVSPGEYQIGLGCHACSPLAVFRHMTAAPRRRITS